MRRVRARVPLGFRFFLLCLALSAGFEMLQFPARRGWMGTFAGAFVLLVAAAWALVQRRPTWTMPVLIGFVNVVGVALNGYHVIVGASLAMCVWTLTGLLASAAVILPWGSRSQALASLGALLSYPLHLEAGTADPLAWAAGATYLLVVLSLGVFGASLFAGHLRNDLELTAALSEREAQLQSYFDLSLVGAAILSSEGRCREVNDEFVRMFASTRAEALGRSWTDFVHPEERATAAALLADVMAGAGARRADLRCVRTDAETIHAIVSFRGLPGPAGAVDHVMVLVQDITERKRADVERERHVTRAEEACRQAEEANRAKDAFLATVSHELRTPLTPILAWSNLLGQGQIDPGQSGAALAAIQRSARAQARLIDDLLDASRIVSGEWRLSLHPLELAPLVRAAIDVVRPAADAKGVRLETTLPAAPVAVRGDAERLQQVVWNLVSNAVKFTPRGGRVDVVLACAGDRARITVRDSGEGIDPEFLPHVFERFRQADSSATRRHGGLGLGLAIVRALVEGHGGGVHADSAGEGQGAVFTVELPLIAGVAPDAPAGDPASQAARADVAARRRRATLGGLRVLVVDDDPSSNAVVDALLASCGAEVRTALSTPQALDIITHWRPDVILSDIAMPGDDGYALLRKLRAPGGTLGRVPAIALTAYTSTAERERVLAAGFEAHVAKPFDPAELAAVVENAVHPAPKPAA